MLPFRVSPTTKHTKLFSQRARSIPIPQTITPDSSDSDLSPVSPPANRSFTFPRDRGNQAATSFFREVTTDNDFDMVDSQLIPDPFQTSPFMTNPAQPEPEHLPSSRAPLNVSGGRLPTPIYNHFPSTNDVTMSVEMDNDSDNLECFATSSQAAQQDLDRDFILPRRHRLPSPISEDETMISPTSGAGGMLQQLNVRNMTDSEQQGWGVATPLPGRPDNKVGSRGWYKGKEKADPQGQMGKTILSMGYRTDCDKCRTRVPGHWSHFIRV